MALSKTEQYIRKALDEASTSPEEAVSNSFFLVVFTRVWMGRFRARQASDCRSLFFALFKFGIAGIKPPGITMILKNVNLSKHGHKVNSHFC